MIDLSSLVNVGQKKSLLVIREKYILAPQTTTHSPDGPPNYQCLDSGPPNYHFLIFWPHPSIYAVNPKQNFENTPPTLLNSHG
jgi:hypothetical protein